MNKWKKIISVFLIVLTITCVFTSCYEVPKDDIVAKVVACDTTYKRSENKTELFVLFDILNGKERDITCFEYDVTLTFYDGTVHDYTFTHKDKIDYSRSTPVRVWENVDGKIEKVQFNEFRFETASYWKTFSGFIISTLLFYIVVAIILVGLAMAEYDGILSICAGALVLICIFFLIFAHFAMSIFIIIGTVIALAPFLVFKLIDY